VQVRSGNDEQRGFMHVSIQEPVVAFTLARFPRRLSMNVLLHLAVDRWPLRRIPGLRFWRLLGVGQGRAFSSRADLQRYALFTVWDSISALQAFECESTLMQRIQTRSEEAWTVYMRPVRWHGLWGGRDPFAGMAPVPAPEAGPWIVLTRATIRPTRLRAFLQAVPAVAQHLLRQPELLNSVGVGEAPLLYQATFSLWRTLPAVTAFAYASAPHRDVVRRTCREEWYSEELFARLRPFASYGTWDGIDPLHLV
jgi:hypothetical protein